MPIDLTPAELDAIEARQARCYIFDRPDDVWVSPEEDAYALLSALRAAWGERDRMRAFAAALFLGERGDWDGGELQELGVKHGVLHEVPVTGPCGEVCACAEYYDEDDAPWTCYRLAPELAALTPPGEGAK